MVVALSLDNKMTDQDKDNYGIEGNEPPLPAKVYKYGKTIG